MSDDQAISPRTTAKDARVSISKHTLSILNHDKDMAAKVDGECWIQNLESVVNEVLRNLEAYEASKPDYVWKNEECKPRVTAAEKQRVDNITNLISRNVFFKSQQYGRVIIDAVMAAWVAQAHVQNQEPQARANLGDAASFPNQGNNQGPPPGLSFEQILRLDPLANVDDSTIVAELHKRKLLSSAFKTAAPADLEQAVQENLDSNLSACSEAKILAKAASLMRTSL
jgi:hypothetical protein